MLDQEALSVPDHFEFYQVISRVGDMVGIKYFPAEPKKQQLEDGRVKLEWSDSIYISFGLLKFPRSQKGGLEEFVMLLKVLVFACT